MIRTAARDRIFKGLLLAAAAAIILICGGMFYSLISGAAPAFDHFGFFRFIASSDWNPKTGSESYGALPFIAGTVLTSLLPCCSAFRCRCRSPFSPANISGAGGSRK